MRMFSFDPNAVYQVICGNETYGLYRGLGIIQVVRDLESRNVKFKVKVFKQY